MTMLEDRGSALRNGAARKPESNRHTATAGAGSCGVIPNNIADVTIGLGGTGVKVLEACAEGDPESIDSLFGIDTSGEVLEIEAGERMLLTTNGQDETILQNRDNYPLLRSDPLLDLLVSDMLLPGEGDGVGKWRALAIRKLAHQLDELKPRLYRLLQRRLARLSGPGPKKLVVSMAASLSGGTGSSMPVILALLVLDTARRLAPNLQVSVAVHVVGPMAFGGVVDTPEELGRDQANCGQSLCELFFAQVPANLIKLAKALGVVPPRRPLFNEVVLYDASDSASRTQTLAEIHERIAANILAAKCPPLRQREGDREANPYMIRTGAGEERAAARILTCARAIISRAPVGPIGKAAAARELITRFDAATAPAEETRVQGLKNATWSALGHEQRRQTLQDQLKPPFLPPGAASKVEGEARNAIQEARARWERKGREDLVNKAIEVGRRTEREAVQKARECLGELEQASGTLTEYTGALHEIHDLLRGRITGLRAERERLASGDHDAAYRQAARALDDPRRWGGRSRRLQALVDSALDNATTEARKTVLKVYHDHWLLPIAEVFQKALASAKASEAALLLKRNELDLQAGALEARIASRGQDVVPVVAPSEVAGLMVRLGQKVRETMGPSPRLPLGRLIETRGEKQPLQDLLESALNESFTRVNKVIEGLGDIRGFARAFDLAFRLEDFLADSIARLTLPASLNLAVRGPGRSPAATFIVAGASLLDDDAVLDTLASAHPGTGADAVAAVPGDPFTVIVRRKISGVDFESIPNLADYLEAKLAFDRLFEETRMPWYKLVSSGLIDGASSVRLVAGIDPDAGVSAEAGAGAAAS